MNVSRMAVSEGRILAAVVLGACAAMVDLRKRKGVDGERIRDMVIFNYTGRRQQQLDCTMQPCRGPFEAGFVAPVDESMIIMIHS